MSDKNKKSNHDRFIALANRLKHASARADEITIGAEDVEVITEEADWVRAFVENRRKANKQIKNPGKKRKADSEIKPESLRKRELRAMKK